MVLGTYSLTAVCACIQLSPGVGELHSVFIWRPRQLLRGVREDSYRSSLSRANGTLDITVPDGRGLSPCPMDPPKWCLPIRATGGLGTRASHPCITTTRPRLGHPAMINVLHNLFGLWSKETRQAV